MSFSAFMSAGGWAVFSLVAAVFSAAFYLVNQYSRQPGGAVVLWMRACVVVLMTPWMFHVDWPRNPAFYAIVAVTAFLGVLGDVRTMNVSAQYGGGVVSRVMPMTVWGSFFLWLLIKPSLIGAYLSHPLNSLGIFAALAGCVYFAARLRRCDLTQAALRAMLPALVAYTFSVTLNKVAMDYGAGEASFSGVVYTYMYVQSLIGVFIMLPLEYRRAGAALRPDRVLLIAALAAAAVWIGHMVHKNYAMAYTANPSYQAAINLTAPVFISVFYWLRRHREEADVLSGMGVVICAIALALLTV